MTDAARDPLDSWWFCLKDFNKTYETANVYAFSITDPANCGEHMQLSIWNKTGETLYLMANGHVVRELPSEPLTNVLGDTQCARIDWVVCHGPRVSSGVSARPGRVFTPTNNTNKTACLTIDDLKQGPIFLDEFGYFLCTENNRPRVTRPFGMTIDQGDLIQLYKSFTTMQSRKEFDDNGEAMPATTACKFVVNYKDDNKLGWMYTIMDGRLMQMMTTTSHSPTQIVYSTGGLELTDDVIKKVIRDYTTKEHERLIGSLDAANSGIIRVNPEDKHCVYTAKTGQMFSLDPRSLVEAWLDTRQLQDPVVAKYDTEALKKEKEALVEELARKEAEIAANKEALKLAEKKVKNLETAPIVETMQAKHSSEYYSAKSKERESEHRYKESLDIPKQRAFDAEILRLQKELAMEKTRHEMIRSKGDSFKGIGAIITGVAAIIGGCLAVFKYLLPRVI